MAKKEIKKAVAPKTKKVATTTKSKKEKIEEPTLSEKDLLIKDIYGDESEKNYFDIPNTTQKTQTLGIIEEYDIDIKRLPEDILNLVNAFLNDFATFLSNTMNVSLIPVLTEKDSKAYSTLLTWVEPRKENLISLKTLNKGGITIKKETEKVVVDSSNVSGFNPSVVTHQSQTPSTPVHDVKQLNPREANGGTYQHTINNSPATPPPSHITENKNIHHEMMSKSTAFQEVHKNQNYQMFSTTPVVPQLNNLEYISSYAENIMSLINSTFQMIHWKYVPLDAVKNIIDKAEKGLQYEIIDSGDGYYYINIKRDGDTVSTPKFKIQ
jgi:hypothetical protein